MRLELLKGKSGKWLFHLKAKNGKILMASETYSTQIKAFEMAVKICRATGLRLVVKKTVE